MQVLEVKMIEECSHGYVAGVKYFTTRAMASAMGAPFDQKLSIQLLT